MDKSCVPVAKLAVSEKKKVLRLWTKYLLSFAVIISTVGSYQVGFIPSTIFEDYL